MSYRLAGFVSFGRSMSIAIVDIDHGLPEVLLLAEFWIEGIAAAEQTFRL